VEVVVVLLIMDRMDHLQELLIKLRLLVLPVLVDQETLI
tara:strand:+ start:394 stop:510 length:117 start_codon:yes stop_codon:yes gene_type:complete